MGQLLELKIEQTYQGQQVINSFQFAETTPAPLDGCAFALATAFGLIPVASIYPAAAPFQKMRLFMAAGVNFVRYTVRTLYSVTDFYEAGFLPGVNGLAATSGDQAAPFLAYGIVSNRVRTDVRKGHKRFAGAQEGDINAGGQMSAGLLAVMQTFCTSISAPITATVSGQAYSFSSAILPKQTLTDNAGDPDDAGEFWPTYAAELAKSAIGLTWAPMPQIRSQVSRQYGRGA